MYTTEVGHTHQVQKAQIHQSDPNLLGSVGFDGTLRVWDLKQQNIS